LVKEKFKNLFVDGHKTLDEDNKENDFRTRSTEEEAHQSSEADEVDQVIENDNENIEQPIEDDYIEDNNDSEQHIDEKDSYAYDELVNPDAVSVDHYDYENSNETVEDSKEKPISENLNNNDEQEEDTLIKELKNAKSKFPLRIRRSMN
jgi:hypothetical protein